MAEVIRFEVRLAPDLVAALDERAGASGMSRNRLIEDILARAVAAPYVKPRYTLRAFGPDASRVTIARESDDPNGVGGGAASLSQAQADAYRRAKVLVQRNDPGDREAAKAALMAVFDEVIEL